MKSRRATFTWIFVGALGVVALLRLVVGVIGLGNVSASGISSFEIGALIVLGLIVTLVSPISYAWWVRKRRVAGLRAAMPGALVFPVSMTWDQGEILRQVGETTSVLHPPQEAAVALSTTGLVYWAGVRSRPAARVTKPVRFSVGEYRMTFSRTDVLYAEVSTGGETTSLPIVLLREEAWFPRGLTRHELCALATKLNDEAP